MKEYFAIEIYERSKHAPSRTWYQSDLYTSPEKAKAAFLDLETYEAFCALYSIQNAEDPPFQFDGEYKDVDDYAKAYEDGVSEIVEIIDSLLAWVQGRKKEWVRTHWIEFGIQNYSVHEEAKKTKIRKDADHTAKLKLVHQSLQTLVNDTAEYWKLAKKGERELKDYSIMADMLLEFREWAVDWLKRNKKFKA